MIGGYIGKPIGGIVSTSAAQTFNDSVTETATAAETVSATVVFAAALTEAATATDTPSTTAVFVSSLTEAASSDDAVSTTATFAASVSEAGSATEAVSTSAVFAASTTEAATATDAYASTAIFVASLTESGAATEAEDADIILRPTAMMIGGGIWPPEDEVKKLYTRRPLPVKPPPLPTTPIADEALLALPVTLEPITRQRDPRLAAILASALDARHHPPPPAEVAPPPVPLLQQKVQEIEAATAAIDQMQLPEIDDAMLIEAQKQIDAMEQQLQNDPMFQQVLRMLQ
jgi:hypothetical protein